MIVGAVGVSDYFGCVSPIYYTYHGVKLRRKRNLSLRRQQRKQKKREDRSWTTNKAKAQAFTKLEVLCVFASRTCKKTKTQRYGRCTNLKTQPLEDGLLIPGIAIESACLLFHAPSY